MTFTTHYLRTPTGMTIEFRTGSRRLDGFPSAHQSAEGKRYVPCAPHQIDQTKQAIRAYVRQALHEDTTFDK